MVKHSISFALPNRYLWQHPPFPYLSLQAPIDWGKWKMEESAGERHKHFPIGLRRPLARPEMGEVVAGLQRHSGRRQQTESDDYANPLIKPWSLLAACYSAWPRLCTAAWRSKCLSGGKQTREAEPLPALRLE